jgi:hypothetical protein
MDTEWNEYRNNCGSSEIACLDSFHDCHPLYSCWLLLWFCISGHRDSGSLVRVFPKIQKGVPLFRSFRDEDNSISCCGTSFSLLVIQICISSDWTSPSVPTISCGYMSFHLGGFLNILDHSVLGFVADLGPELHTWTALISFQSLVWVIPAFGGI